MNTRILPLAMILGAAAPAFASVPGHARVDWIAESRSCQPGKPLMTAIRMMIEDGWHTYWSNPGDAGMATSFEWSLPEGWKAGEPGHPVPKQFVAEGLGSYGYEGVVLYPLEITPPDGFTGTAELKGKVTWLACNDGGCVPGQAEIMLTLEAGPVSASAEAAAIQQALRLVPKAAPAGMTLRFREEDGEWRLHLLPGADRGPDLAGSPAFPATPQVVAATAAIRFQAHPENGWIARAAKSGFAPESVTGLQLVVTPPAPASPFSILGLPLAK